MKRILLYGLGLAGGATLLSWIHYRHAVRLAPTELYIGIIAVSFTGLGIWVGRRALQPKPAAEDDGLNDKAREALGISDREYEVLELLAEGLTNKDIAKRLFVSPNTVKTHLARLYEKLEVKRRTQAVHKARELKLLR